MDHTPLKTYLNIKEAASHCGVSVRKVHCLFQSGAFPRVKLGQGNRARVLFRREDLDRYMAAHLEQGGGA